MYRLFDAWRRVFAFRKASRELKKACREARTAWFEERICQAEAAARKHDIGAVHHAINTLAPRRSREKVRIKGSGGELLSPKAEFDEIYGYFSKAFGSQCQGPDAVPCQPMRFDPAELLTAIRTMKKGKAVPTTSLPAEVWQLCDAEFAHFLSRVLAKEQVPVKPFPPEVTHCTLSLLPKPHKPSKRPQDLRPLGLQDPSSKIVASVVRNQLQEHTLQYLCARPQYAYTPGKAIDEAIAQVMQHCAGVRERLRSTTRSVHDRRAKKASVPCMGGVVLGIDLSRAFDEVPRWALLLALQRAGAPAELQQSVMQLHATCRYKVMHKGYARDFPMQRGVRQGCALSPYLYALFTCLLHDEIAACTSREWAARAATLFADDTHLSWDIAAESDLRFVMHCVQQTFRVFQKYGMKVNPAKSQLIVQTRGAAAQRWLRKHLHRTATGWVVELGTPAQSLRTPRVRQMVYLGVIASYASFEQQSCMHRVN